MTGPGTSRGASFLPFSLFSLLLVAEGGEGQVFLPPSHSGYLGGAGSPDTTRSSKWPERRPSIDYLWIRVRVG